MMTSRLRQTELQMQFAQLTVPGNCPEGMYISMAEDNDRLLGVIFVRKGYYQGCILRFTIVYPINDSNLPPVVHFEKGSVVHPLVDPSSDQLSIASAFPTWDHRIHNLTRLLYFIKGIFKKRVLDSLNGSLVSNAEAWRLYRFNNSVFKKLAAQCALVSASPSTLYKVSEQMKEKEVGSKSSKGLRDLAIRFRQIEDEELQELRQVIFAD